VHETISKAASTSPFSATVRRGERLEFALNRAHFKCAHIDAPAGVVIHSASARGYANSETAPALLTLPAGVVIPLACRASYANSEDWTPAYCFSRWPA